jgi:RTX calcium-binding nonapeptide repeat (4 copies)
MTRSSVAAEKMSCVEAMATTRCWRAPLGIRFTATGGDDTIVAGLGYDHIWPQLGNDTVDGGRGRDLVAFFSRTDGIVASLRTGVVTGGSGNDTLTGVEDLVGTKFEDTFNGDVHGNWFVGKEGNDFLHGHGGKDTVDGNAGSDDLYRGQGDDRISGWIGNDVIGGGAGMESLVRAGRQRSHPRQRRLRRPRFGRQWVRQGARRWPRCGEADRKRPLLLTSLPVVFWAVLSDEIGKSGG